VQALVAALASGRVAAIGPAVAGALRERGVRVDAMPGASWFMKPLASELVKLLGGPPGGQAGAQA
jgi:uroporphyrinogen-III synthase